MKKATAILLITIHLVSLTGRSLFVEYLIHQNDLKVERQIDAGNYNKAQLIEMRVPLTLSYYSSSLNYEPYYGEIDFDGKYYNYVMRKVVNDTVYLICLANTAKAELNKAKQENASNAADINGSSPVKKTAESLLKKQISSNDYLQQTGQFIVEEIATDQAGKDLIVFSSDLKSAYIEKAYMPPEMNSNDDLFI